MLEGFPDTIKNGADLRALRKRLKLSQDDMGRLLRLSAERPGNTIGNWERGVNDPPATALFTLSLIDVISRLVSPPAGKGS